MSRREADAMADHHVWHLSACHGVFLVAGHLTPEQASTLADECQALRDSDVLPPEYYMAGDAQSTWYQAWMERGCRVMAREHLALVEACLRVKL